MRGDGKKGSPVRNATIQSAIYNLFRLPPHRSALFPIHHQAVVRRPIPHPRLAKGVVSFSLRHTER